MATRKLDVVLLSASDLKKVNKSKMHAYAVAWIDPCVRVPGPTDKKNGSNPVWNSTITVNLEARTLGQGAHLHIELLGHGFLSTKFIGSVKVDLSDLLQQGAKGAAAKTKFYSREVIRPSGESRGTISFELHLQESPALLAQAAEQAARDANLNVE